MVIIDLLTGSAIGAVVATVGNIIAARYGWLVRKEANIYKRLTQVEESEKECRDELFEVKTQLNTFWLICDFLSHKVPDAEKEVKELLKRVKERSDLHKTKG